MIRVIQLTHGYGYGQGSIEQPTSPDFLGLRIGIWDSLGLGCAFFSLNTFIVVVKYCLFVIFHKQTA